MFTFGSLYGTAEVSADSYEIPLNWFPNLRLQGGQLVLLGKCASISFNGNGFPTPSKYVCKVAYGDDERLLTEHRNIRNAIRNRPVTILIEIDGGWICAGLAFFAELANVGGMLEFVFKLQSKLPRKLWISLGGYDDWLVYINGTHNVFSSIAEFQSIVASIPKIAKMFITRYEEDVLDLFFYHNDAVVIYTDNIGASYVSTSDLEAHGESVCVFQIDDVTYEFPMYQVVASRTAIDIAFAYISTGRPSSLVKFHIDKS